MNTDGRITMNADGKGTKWKRNNCTYGEDKANDDEMITEVMSMKNMWMMMMVTITMMMRKMT